MLHHQTKQAHSLMCALITTEQMERPFSVWSNADHTGIWWKQSGLGLAESRLDMFFPGKVMDEVFEGIRKERNW